MIAVLGTGLLGSNFTRALIKKGETVHVWNRTFERAKALEAEGAKAFADAAQAVAGASRVHIVVSDDAAVDGVLAAAHCAPGMLVIDHSTTSTAGAKARTARTDLTYVHAPVFMGPQNALESTGLMLISGERVRVERVKPLLTTMTGKLIDLGERVDAATAFKLMGNTFLMGFTAAIGDLIGLGKALGFSASEAITLFEHFNPGAMTGARSKRMASGDYTQPSWELAMARKDARLVQEEVDRAHVALVLVPAIAARMDEMIKRGHSHDDWTVIAKDFV
ncbi:MAG TPA: NAD(P)-binding domain-containing protein [Kofleriaceae bacterium]|nr:NAD(P)-binding domain-containing protein [Kofleriaceae bacterium]